MTFPNKFTFIDLFAGIGGFHQALEQLGGDCVLASEFHLETQNIYRLNYQNKMSGPIVGDIVPLTEPSVSPVIPPHDVLAGGFPCQPFSKSGLQRGIEETRGTLFFNILNIVKHRLPQYIILENVPNLVGPKHRETWTQIVSQLRLLGYRVSSTPTIFSPHLLPPRMGGAPQIRNRVYIFGKYVGIDAAMNEFGSENFYIPNQPVDGWSPGNWNLDDYLLDKDIETSEMKLGHERKLALDAWAGFLKIVGSPTGRKLPGFPIWEWALQPVPELGDQMPVWKLNFLKKNAAFYVENAKAIEKWRSLYPYISKLPNSYRKLEWQADDAPAFSDCAIQFRPSGLRVKKANYLPALVALNQPSYIGSVSRFISVKEAARLQSFSPNFEFGNQSAALSMKQLGNAVSVSAVKYVFQKFVEEYSEVGGI